MYMVVFRIKISIRITKTKYVFPFEKKYFDSLALKPLGYTRPSCSLFSTFNLVYRQLKSSDK
ncbi:unnamed protein product [Tenebrio molitor]|nr:unnamed protein product [Tenebrio molitor]